MIYFLFDISDLLVHILQCIIHLRKWDLLKVKAINQYLWIQQYLRLNKIKFLNSLKKA